MASMRRCPRSWYGLGGGKLDVSTLSPSIAPILSVLCGLSVDVLAWSPCLCRLCYPFPSDAHTPRASSCGFPGRLLKTTDVHPPSRVRPSPARLQSPEHGDEEAVDGAELLLMKFPPHLVPRLCSRAPVRGGSRQGSPRLCTEHDVAARQKSPCCRGTGAFHHWHLFNCCGASLTA